jgi:hypothetical protein
MKNSCHSVVVGVAVLLAACVSVPERLGDCTELDSLSCALSGQTSSLMVQRLLGEPTSRRSVGSTVEWEYLCSRHPRDHLLSVRFRDHRIRYANRAQNMKSLAARGTILGMQLPEETLSRLRGMQAGMEALGASPHLVLVEGWSVEEMSTRSPPDV